MARTIKSFALALTTLISSATALLLPSPHAGNSLYSYVGCYQETTDVPNTNGERALNDGDVWVSPDYMTVPSCLDFCGGQSLGIVYKYAGLEYSR